MKYRYTTISDPSHPNRPAWHRPMVDFKIYGLRDGLTLTGLLDSGADYTIVSSQVAKAVGIELGGIISQPIVGIGGGAMGKLAYADVEINQMERVKIPVLFVDDFKYVLLGQVGIFDYFKIKFERDHFTFEIVPTKKTAR